MSRLAAAAGFISTPWRGFGTREQRLYLLQSLACQPGEDRRRSEYLLFRTALRTIASGGAPRLQLAIKSRELCVHQKYFYEDCCRCVEEYADNILAIATETRRAETLGSVEDEGAGPKDIAGKGH